MRSWNSDLDLMNKEISKLYKSVSEMSIGDKYRERYVRVQPGHQACRLFDFRCENNSVFILHRFSGLNCISMQALIFAVFIKACHE